MMAPWRRLPAFLLLLALYLLAPACVAATYTFNNDKIDNCKRTGKEYECTSLPLSNEYDQIVIANGVLVKVLSDVRFGYNQSLTMSGSARLTSTGNLSIADIAPANLKVTGGSFGAAGTFSVGNQVHNLKADVDAGKLMLGAGSGLQITGKLVASGEVQIGSNTTINGPVEGGTISIGSPVKIYGAVKSAGTLQIGSHAIIEGAVSGSTINADSPASIKGDVTATQRFTLGSGSTVNGSIKAPETELYSSSSTVSGNVTASKQLVMGSSTKINGDVDTGQLTLYASDALIGGNASVDYAYLNWHGRVSKKIFCKNGTRPGQCDCVKNDSGYEVNTANGPRCEAASPPPNGLHHFLITHDGSAGTCAVEYVKVSACANADCSAPYNGGATVTMAPGGATVLIDSSGVNNRAPVSSIATGKIDLGLTQGGVKPSVQCFDGKSNSCAMAFTGGANFSIGVADDKAGNTITATIRALKANDSQSACVPAFTDEKPVQYSCDYVAPNSGAAEMRLATNAGATGTFACNASSQLKTKFNEAGIATVQLAYPDAGRVALKASFETATGRSEFVMAPDHFTLTAVAPMRAGADFKVDLEARNKDGKVTPNFDRDTLLAKATETTVALDCLGAGMAGSLESVKTEFSKGKASATLNFSEAGYLDLLASQSGFLDSKLTTLGSTGGIVDGACQAEAGPFVPAYFQVELNDTNRAKTNFYYSREPIPLKLSARNAKGEVTKNYPLGHGGDDVIKFSAVRPDNGAPFDPVLGAVSGEFEARYFVAGEAPQAGPAQHGARIAQPAFTFANALTAPSQIRLRAANDATDANLRITSVYTPTGNAAAEPEQASPYIRTGRLRLGKRFGRVGTQPLEMPLTVEYWSGKSWVLNTQDSFTVMPASAFAQQPGGDGAARPTANTLANVALANGAGILKVTGDAAGWIDIAVNLGPANQQDTSCLATHPASTGAGLPWLRSPLACNGQAGTPSTDPSARATFGIFPIENRRIIHVREVFN
ncbi:hypothetical protein NM04_02470 [Massilia aurea]|uniref:DUF6701 domain-containing protein n=1 Tax=Massilia aurea TaxID=373040 RepID=A0A422QQN5_9BURK|nr:polymer-forming cytoskeletal protein [Massilia aurea]RNF32303.1 hypothetical protein NM04_02470 [Massilia aurea]